QINTAAQGLDLLQQVGRDNLNLLLDSYHMNIEEADPADALNATGVRLGLYHAADSNRQAPGHGHTDFASQFAALQAVGYAGPVIVELTASGPDPFPPDKGPEFRSVVTRELDAAARYLRAL